MGKIGQKIGAIALTISLLNSGVSYALAGNSVTNQEGTEISIDNPVDMNAGDLNDEQLEAFALDREHYEFLKANNITLDAEGNIIVDTVEKFNLIVKNFCKYARTIKLESSEFYWSHFFVFVSYNNIDKSVLKTLVNNWEIDKEYLKQDAVYGPSCSRLSVMGELALQLHDYEIYPDYMWLVLNAKTRRAIKEQRQRNIEAAQALENGDYIKLEAIDQENLKLIFATDSQEYNIDNPEFCAGFFPERLTYLGWVINAANGVYTSKFVAHAFSEERTAKSLSAQEKIIIDGLFAKTAKLN